MKHRPSGIACSVTPKEVQAVVTTITIEVRGGIVQDVTCDGAAPVRVIVKDYDGDDAFDEFEFNV